ncbi:MAG: hypothetical protein WA982_17890 [Rubrobacteraceae bacterium]
MKHMSFVTTVGEILPNEANEVSELAETISYWNEGTCPPDEWLRRIKDSWGPAGFAMRRGEEVLGFMIFGPVEFLPRVSRLSGKLSNGNPILLASVTGDRRVKKHLLVRMLKDLRHRGVAGVEAVASDFGASRHVSTRFLLENGWRPVRRVGPLGLSYTVMRTDLGHTVEVGELARDIIGRVKLPKLKNASPAPGGACVQVELVAQVEPSPENGRTAVLTAEIPSGVVA